MSERAVSCNDSSITFVIDDATNDVRSIVVQSGIDPITISLLNQNGSVKASVSINANTSRTFNLNPSQRVQAFLENIIKGDGTTKQVLTFRHRVFW